MKLYCDKCGNDKRFITETIYIQEEWIVDNNGNFIEVLEVGECLKKANRFYCMECGHRIK